MFRTKEVNIQDLIDFIEKPSQNFKEEKELSKGVEQVCHVLNKNPIVIMRIIKEHPVIPASFLLGDLADKMAKIKKLDKLELLLNSCFDELTSTCIYNSQDLIRFLKAFPTSSDKILKFLISNEECIKRIFDNDNDPKQTLKEISANFPSYQEQFSESYNKCYHIFDVFYV